MEAKDLPVGQRVVGISGYGGSCHRFGHVTRIVESRWGTHAEVELDEGGYESILSLTGRAVERVGYARPIEGAGCGWYVVETEEVAS